MSTAARDHEYEDHYEALDEQYDRFVQDCEHEWEPLPLLGDGWRRCAKCWLAEDAGKGERDEQAE